MCCEKVNITQPYSPVYYSCLCESHYEVYFKVNLLYRGLLQC